MEAKLSSTVGSIQSKFWRGVEFRAGTAAGIDTTRARKKRPPRLKEAVNADTISAGPGARGGWGKHRGCTERLIGGVRR